MTKAKKDEPTPPKQPVGNWTDGLRTADLAVLVSVAEDIEVLLRDPQASEPMAHFREQMTRFAEKWQAYETSRRATENGTWNGSMGKPPHPLAPLWPDGYGEVPEPSRPGLLTLPLYSYSRDDKKPVAYAVATVLHDQMLPKCKPVNEGQLPAELVEMMKDVIRDSPESEGLGPTGCRYVPSLQQVREALKIVTADLRRSSETAFQREIMAALRPGRAGKNVEKMSETADDAYIPFTKAIEFGKGVLTRKKLEKAIEKGQPVKVRARTPRKQRRDVHIQDVLRLIDNLTVNDSVKEEAARMFGEYVKAFLSRQSKPDLR